MEKAFGDFPKFDINMPAIDMSEKENSILIKLDMPGIEKEDINIIADENNIEVKAKRKEIKEEKGENFFRKERSYRSYQREISVPVKINPDNIQAKYSHGVLTLTVEKKEKEKIKKKKIRVN